jgi:hypothetical protein
MWNRKRMARGTVGLACSLMLTAGPGLHAQEHLVPLEELNRRAVDSSRKRTEDMARLRNFFASEPVRKALAQTRLEPAAIERAIATLSDDDLARLAARAGSVQSEFAAGALTNQQLTYIVIALATAVLILVIVAA